MTENGKQDVIARVVLIHPKQSLAKRERVIEEYHPLKGDCHALRARNDNVWEIASHFVLAMTGNGKLLRNPVEWRGNDKTRCHCEGAAGRRGNLR